MPSGVCDSFEVVNLLIPILIEKSATRKCDVWCVFLGFLGPVHRGGQWVELTSMDQSAEAYKALLAVLTVQYTLSLRPPSRIV